MCPAWRAQSLGRRHLLNDRLTPGQVLLQRVPKLREGVGGPLLRFGREDEAREGLPEKGTFEGWTDPDGQ